MGTVRWYDRAVKRVCRHPALFPHYTTLLTGDKDGDHYEWVAIAPVGELVRWAEAVEEDACFT